MVRRLGGIFDYDHKKERLEEVLRELEDPAIWNDQSRAQAMAKEKGELENIVGVFVDGEIVVDDGGGSATVSGTVGGKYLPFESNAVVSSGLTASVYASQVIDTIAV